MIFYNSYAIAKSKIRITEKRADHSLRDEQVC